MADHIADAIGDKTVGAGAPVAPSRRPVGVAAHRARLRLFGVLPFDYDYLTIAELEPGRHFREESTMLSGRGRPRCALQPSPSAAAASLRRHDRLSTATHSTWWVSGNESNTRTSSTV
jgi:hypothetical protein